MKPLILLTGGTGAAANGTPTWALNQNYAENIRRAGGIPILAVNNDCAEEYADLADGLLLSGGKDVEPKLYGQEKMFDFVITDPQRDDLEYKIIKAFVDRKKPIWGICRGIQLLNVGLGGTLYQDIPSQVTREFPIAHKQPFHYISFSHRVAITPGTRLHTICQADSIGVNSSHHQAIKALANGLVTTGKTSDGLIEAVEMPDYPFFVGVQWHPEYLWPEDAAAERLFTFFVTACSEHA